MKTLALGEIQDRDFLLIVLGTQEKMKGTVELALIAPLSSLVPFALKSFLREQPLQMQVSLPQPVALPHLSTTVQLSTRRLLTVKRPRQVVTC